jgi:D-beta-D-heptose 7-phosphate kinase/D-beta-D-heptose 1-phosphate adenosyltransferase
LELVTALKPDFIVKGREYASQKIIGADIVTAHGGKVLLIPTLDGHSTSNLAPD